MFRFCSGVRDCSGRVVGGWMEEMVESKGDASALIFQIVGKLPFFSEVDPLLLAEIGQEFRIRFYTKDEPLFRQGDDPEDLIVILNGRVSISAQERNSPCEDISIATRGPGEILGEQAFIENISRTATATALETVRGLLVGRSGVLRLLNERNFQRNLLRALSKKLSEATDARSFRYRNENLLFGGFRSHVSPEVAQ